MRNSFATSGCFFICGCLAALAGCAGYRDPIVVVSDARVTDRSDEAIRLNFTLDLDNPNSAAKQGLRLSEFEYDVTINGTRAYSGLWAAQATLAPGDHRQLIIPAIIRYDTLGWTDQVPDAVQFSISGSLTYIAPGELSRTFREMGFPAPSAHFKRAAQMTIQD